MSKIHEVVIVGGGFGGLSAARTLKDAPVRVTLIDKRNFHLFQPLLYQAATGLLCPAEITTPLRHILRNQKNTRVFLGEVVDIDPQHHRVILEDGTAIEYDSLVIAAGARNNYFGHDQWTRYAPGLKTIEDTIKIRQRIFSAFELAEREPDQATRSQWLTFAVVGSGPTGIELAGMLAEITGRTLREEFRNIKPEDSRIILVDAADRVLPSYPPDLSKRAQRSLMRLGISIQTGTRVQDITGEGITLERNGERYFVPARTVLWSAGISATLLSSRIAAVTRAETDRMGRVFVNADLTLPDYPDIFVIGDLAHCRTRKGEALPGLAPVATQQGRYVARVIRNRLSGRSRTRPFGYFDKGTMAVIGRHEAIANIGRLHFGGFIAWLLWLFIHLFLLINFENRLVVLIRWAFQYFSYTSGARQLLEDGDSSWSKKGDVNHKSVN